MKPSDKPIPDPDEAKKTARAKQLRNLMQDAESAEPSIDTSPRGITNQAAAQAAKKARSSRKRK